MSEEKQIGIYFTREEAEIVKRFLQFQEVWEKIFADDFVGSLTIHKGKFNPDIEFEWRIRESYPHFNSEHLTKEK